MPEARPGAPGSIQRRRARVSLSILGVNYRSLRVARWQTTVGQNMLPDQSSLGIGNVGVQNFRFGIDAVWEVRRNEQPSRVTIKHLMERHAPSVAFLPGGRRPMKRPYPIAYPLRAPCPADVDGVAGFAACDQIDARTVRQACTVDPRDVIGKRQFHQTPNCERPRV